MFYNLISPNGMNKLNFKNGAIALFLILIGYFSPQIFESFHLSSKINSFVPDSTFSTIQGQYEIVLIYIGCSSCSASNVPGLPESVIEIKSELFKMTQDYGYDFHTIGISKDHIIKEEIIHLTKFGYFQEILIGNDWSNSGILKYVYNDIPGPASIPQIIITKRKYRAISNFNKTAYRAVESENLLVRKIGPEEIKEFALQKVPLPTDSFDFNF